MPPDTINSQQPPPPLPPKRMSRVITHEEVLEETLEQQQSEEQEIETRLAKDAIIASSTAAPVTATTSIKSNPNDTVVPNEAVSGGDCGNEVGAGVSNTTSNNDDSSWVVYNNTNTILTPEKKREAALLLASKEEEQEESSSQPILAKQPEPTPSSFGDAAARIQNKNIVSSLLLSAAATATPARISETNSITTIGSDILSPKSALDNRAAALEAAMALVKQPKSMPPIDKFADSDLAEIRKKKNMAISTNNKTQTESMVVQLLSNLHQSGSNTTNNSSSLPLSSSSPSSVAAATTTTSATAAAAALLQGMHTTTTSGHQTESSPSRTGIVRQRNKRVLPTRVNLQATTTSNPPKKFRPSPDANTKDDEIFAALALQRAKSQDKDQKNFYWKEKKKNTVNSEDKDIVHLNDVQLHDVLLGHSPMWRKNPGNIALRKLVSERYDIYKDSTKREKTELSLEVVDAVLKNGGRFLKLLDPNNSKEWVETNALEARQKVASSFRDQRKKDKRAAEYVEPWNRKPRQSSEQEEKNMLKTTQPKEESIPEEDQQEGKGNESQPAHPRSSQDEKEPTIEKIIHTNQPSYTTTTTNTPLDKLYKAASSSQPYSSLPTQASTTITTNASAASHEPRAAAAVPSTIGPLREETNPSPQHSMVLPPMTSTLEQQIASSAEHGNSSALIELMMGQILQKKIMNNDHSQMLLNSFKNSDRPWK